jgi:RNA polymerase sigma-70 factor, ECF subfamily
MEGNCVSAILIAPITPADVETGEEILPGSQNSDLGASFSGFVEGFLPGESPGDPSAVPAPQCGFFSYSPDPGAAAAPPEADAAIAANAWPSSQEPIPQSPGAILVKEFNALYHKYERRVYRQCFRMLGNQEDAEDLTQEVFLQLYRKAHTFRGESSFSTWLHRLTINTVLMRLRRHRWWRDSVTSLDIAPGSEGATSDPQKMASALPAPPARTLDNISLDVAIQQLSSGYKEILLLHDLEGYQHEEIAKLLGISAGTSKSQLHKARLRVRGLLESVGGKGAGVHAGPREKHKKRPSHRAPVFAMA